VEFRPDCRCFGHVQRPHRQPELAQPVHDSCPDTDNIDYDHGGLVVGCRFVIRILDPASGLHRVQTAPRFDSLDPAVAALAQGRPVIAVAGNVEPPHGIIALALGGFPGPGGFDQRQGNERVRVLPRELAQHVDADVIAIQPPVLDVGLDLRLVRRLGCPAVHVIVIQRWAKRVNSS
jgi:hypothetical protein